MVPGNSDGIPRVPPYSGVSPDRMLARVRGLHPLRRAVPDASPVLTRYPPPGPITPAHASRHRRFGLLPVRSPLLGESFLLSFPAGTKMFQFPAFASRNSRDAGIAPGGLPHSEIRRSQGICPSLRLFAACHVLLRLREPRHPPCALLSFRFSVTTSILTPCVSPFFAPGPPSASMPKPGPALVCSTLLFLVCLAFRHGHRRALSFHHVIVLSQK